LTVGKEWGGLGASFLDHTIAYDLTGLVRRLEELEPQFRQVEEEIKSRRRAVGRPEGLGRARDASP
jgi:hypothetical protein